MIFMRDLKLDAICQEVFVFQKFLYVILYQLCRFLLLPPRGIVYHWFRYIRILVVSPDSVWQRFKSTVQTIHKPLSQMWPLSQMGNIQYHTRLDVFLEKKQRPLGQQMYWNCNAFFIANKNIRSHHKWFMFTASWLHFSRATVLFAVRLLRQSLGRPFKRSVAIQIQVESCWHVVSYCYGYYENNLSIVWTMLFYAECAHLVPLYAHISSLKEHWTKDKTMEGFWSYFDKLLARTHLNTLKGIQ